MSHRRLVFETTYSVFEFDDEVKLRLPRLQMTIEKIVDAENEVVLGWRCMSTQKCYATLEAAINGALGHYVEFVIDTKHDFVITDAGEVE